MSYKLPPQDILAAADAPQTPLATISPSRDCVLFVEYEMQVPIEVLARPYHKLAGIRLDPGLNGRRRMIRFTGFELLNLEDRKTVRVDLPENGTVGRMPFWAPDGTLVFLTLDTDEGIQLWAIEPHSGHTERVGDSVLNDTLVPITFSSSNQAFAWLPNGKLMARLVSRSQPSVEPPAVPDGPRIDETSGKRSQMATFQDLLATEFDEDLFEHFATSQLAIVDVTSGETTPVGKPGLYADIDASPSGEFLLVTELHRPFSFRVPYSYFTRTLEVWNMSGRVVSRIADLPVSDEVPRQGVPTGPRQAEWQQNLPASVVWAEALDGGDPTVSVEHRDRVMRHNALAEETEHLFDVRHRLIGWEWLEADDEAFYTEWDRDRRWRTTYHVDLTAPDKSRPIIDISVNERYDNPGWPVSQFLADGTRRLLQDGSRIYLAGQGQTPERARPFLRRLDLLSLEVDELFRCDNESYESFWGFVSTRESVLTRRESPSESPNYFLINLNSGSREQMTNLPDPHPEVTGVKKQIIRYTRADGVELSAMLYLPPGYEKKKEEASVPVFIWAYPLDYSDPATAGQVTGSDRGFTRLSGASPLWLLMRGWAVLMDAKMPIIGDPETMNDTYIEQVVDSATAAVEVLIELGVADSKRVAIGGHSYGAFMTTNLLAHTDLFAAGVARSGAYNRSLTPFGFQTERRSYWEVPNVYQRVSPYNYAHQIESPLLLIHGAEDNNTGTFPIQSERLFQAIQGNGGTSRLVILPLESHGYLARESNLHVIAETIEWLEKFVR